MSPPDRRRFLRSTGAALASGLILPRARILSTEGRAHSQDGGGAPQKPPDGVTVINPRGRVPVSLIIDDSTCLVNLAHFAIPQFHEVFPDQYHQPWKSSAAGDSGRVRPAVRRVVRRARREGKV